VRTDLRFPMLADSQMNSIYDCYVIESDSINLIVATRIAMGGLKVTFDSRQQHQSVRVSQSVTAVPHVLEG
jgi:hypothetical protein